VTDVNLVGPTLLLVLGAALGAATQMSPEATMGLRVPSLFAAFFMVAQGLVELERARRDRARAAAATPAVTHPVRPGGGPDLDAARPAYQAPPPPPSGPPNKAGTAIPLLLMALAAWLGLAVLNGAGNQAIALSVLATLSAFLLFAIGWQVLLASR